MHSSLSLPPFLVPSQIGSFFMINLCLVVIATQFSETKRRETAKMKAERARFHTQSSSTLSSYTYSETTNCYRQVIRLLAHLLRRLRSRSRKAYRAARWRQLERKERRLMKAQTEGKLGNSSVVKNVSTHSVVNAADGEWRERGPRAKFAKIGHLIQGRERES